VSIIWVCLNIGYNYHQTCCLYEQHYDTPSNLGVHTYPNYLFSDRPNSVESSRHRDMLNNRISCMESIEQYITSRTYSTNQII
jgi:hypothetical protein